MKPQVIYIMSLGHSGSTLLELLFNLHFDEVTSLGEIYQTYKRRGQEQRICTCKSEVSACDFWKHIDFHEDQSFEHFYSHVLLNVKSRVITDSSKSLAVFKKHHLQRSKEGNTRVIFLRKGLSAYYSSVKKKRNVEKSFLKRWLFYNFISTSYVWARYNHKIHGFLQKEGVSFLSVKYEDLCNNTDLVMQEIGKGFGLERKEASVLDNVHQLRGNEMRFSFMEKPIVRPYSEKTGQNNLPGRFLLSINKRYSKKWEKVRSQNTQSGEAKL